MLRKVLLPSRTVWRRGVTGAALGLPLLLLSSCGGQAAKPQQPLAVQTALVGEGRFAPGIDVVSVIQSTSNVVMRPEANGRVVRILATQGQRVKAGQPILVLDNVQETATLNANRAEAIKNRANAERYIFLNEQGAVSTKERDFYVTQAIQSADQVRASAANLGYKFVTAPIDGIIGNPAKGVKRHCRLTHGIGQDTGRCKKRL